MIKKLRVKFIALSMASLLLVLTLIMLSVNIVNYRGIVQEADSLLEFLAENGGAFPKDKEHKAGFSGLPMSPELPYESRYFSVMLDDKGETVFVDTGKIAAVDSSAAVDYAQSVLSEGKERGFLNRYRYAVFSEGENSRIIFLDCGRNIDTWRSFMLVSCGISLLGCVAVFVLIVLFSGRIIRPVSESYQKQKQFITDAGHEIKTPLTIIAADADVLEMDLGENEWLQDIQRQTGRLTELTNELIYLSRMEEQQSMQMLDFPMSDMVEEVCHSFQALALTQNKSFETHIQPLLTQHGDEKALRELVNILLDNALKYSPERGSISLSLEKQGRGLRLELRNDCAAELSRESLGKLFERFYRADPSRSSQTGGYGIGLSIARAIVSAHKGKITAESTDGRTLSISVSLPQ